MVPLLDDDLMEAMEERSRIEATHSWLFRCFPPGPATCTFCGANRSDPDLKPCSLFST